MPASRAIVLGRRAVVAALGEVPERDLDDLLAALLGGHAGHARYMLVTALTLLPPDLDRDLLDRQRDRRLGLGGLDRHALGAELRREPVGDHRAQALERPVGLRLGDQRDHLADLAVVDRVLDAVGDQRVGLARVEADVEQDPLADLALLGGDAVVRVERQPDDLDGDPDLEALLVVIVVVRSSSS